MLTAGSGLKKRETLTQRNLDRKLDQLQMSKSFRSMMQGVGVKRRVVSDLDKH